MCILIICTCSVAHHLKNSVELGTSLLVPFLLNKEHGSVNKPWPEDVYLYTLSHRLHEARSYCAPPTLKRTQPMLKSVSGSSAGHCSTSVCVHSGDILTHNVRHVLCAHNTCVHICTYTLCVEALICYVHAIQVNTMLHTLAFGRSSSAYLMAACNLTTCGG